MGRDIRRFAPFGLYISGLAAIITIGLAIVLRSFTLPVQISAGFIIIGLALYVLLDPRGTREALMGRQARYGSNALLMTLAVIGIVIVVNFLVSTHSKQWDLTEDQQNSLTAESIKTLESLKSPVKANAFYTPNTNSDTANTLLQNFKNKSGGKFDYQFINPETNPILAQQEKVVKDGTIVLTMDNRQEQVSFASEEEITSALVRLDNPGKRVLYFLTGHGEYVTDTSNQNNYNAVDLTLTAKNYTVNTLNLLSTGKIPEDALALVVAGPTKPLSQQEVDLIKAYQEKGGSLIYLTEPRPVTQFGDQPDPLETYLQTTWGIILNNDVIIDKTSSQAIVAVSQRFGSHPITQKMNTLAIVLPTARSIAVGSAPSGVDLTPLAFTAESAYGETDFEALKNNQTQFDQGKDIPGPLTLAVAGQNNNNKARVVVIGDSDFAGTQGFTSYGNSDFILNSLDWAAAQDNLISLNPRQPIQRFFAPLQQTTMGLILLGSIFLLPGLVLLMGIAVWVQRRSRG